MSAAPSLAVIDGTKWEQDPLIPDGSYRLKFEYYETKKIFGNNKLALRFTVVDYGPAFGAPVTRWYNVKRIVGKPARYGGFMASGKRCDLYIEHTELFDIKIPRLDRVPMRPFEGKYILGEVTTVRRRSDQRELPEQSQYSKVARLIKVVEP